MSHVTDSTDANQCENATGGDLARNPPEQHKDVRTQSYRSERLRSIAAETETSPSAGWRRVYYEMGVSPR